MCFVDVNAVLKALDLLRRWQPVGLLHVAASLEKSFA
jgi:hypothetical protein